MPQQAAKVTESFVARAVSFVVPPLGREFIVTVMPGVYDDQDGHGADRPVNAARPEADEHPPPYGDALPVEFHGRVRPALEDVVRLGGPAVAVPGRVDRDRR